jgi:hypothetical protein
MHGEMRSAYSIVVLNLKDGDPLQDLGIDEMALKYILKN